MMMQHDRNIIRRCKNCSKLYNGYQRQLENIVKIAVNYNDLTFN